jgi:hypothetical protein
MWNQCCSLCDLKLWRVMVMGVCTAKSRSVEEDAPVCHWEYWPYWFRIGGDRDGFCIAGSCPTVCGTIPVSASGWTSVMFKWWGFIVLAYTNNGLFLPTCEEVWNGWLYTGRGWQEKLLGFRCLIFNSLNQGWQVTTPPELVTIQNLAQIDCTVRRCFLN